MNRKLFWIGLPAAGAVAGIILAAFVFSPESTEAREVQVREDGAVVASASAEDAVAKVSKRVGFEVKLPGSVPYPLKLVFVDSVLGPEGVPNAMKLAVLSYGPADSARQGQVNLRIEQAGVRFASPDDRAQKIDLGVAGVDAYFQATDRASGYWVFTEHRGFLVTVTGPASPSQPEVYKLLASLVSD